VAKDYVICVAHYHELCLSQFHTQTCKHGHYHYNIYLILKSIIIISIKVVLLFLFRSHWTWWTRSVNCTL